MTFPHDPERPQRPARQPDVVLEPDHAAAEFDDQIVRAIFAVGLHLQGTAEIAADPLVRRRIEKALSDLDGMVRVIWDTVFRLDHHLDGRGDHHLNSRGPRGDHAPGRTSPSPTPPSPVQLMTPRRPAPAPSSGESPAGDLGYTASAKPPSLLADP